MLEGELWTFREAALRVWSATLRVYIKNGGEIKAEHFKTEQKPSYSDYADQIIEEGIQKLHNKLTLSAIN